MLHHCFLKKRILIFSAGVLILNACGSVAQLTGNKCIAYRAAFDVGSASTKMKVARVNKCLQKSEAIIYRNEIKVPYAENKQSGVFSPQIRNRGIIALQRLKEEAISKKAAAFSGVATESFRQSGNSLEFLGEVKEKTGISIKLIDHDQEAILGYLAACSFFPENSRNVIVWDIGGASMQIILRNENKEFEIYRGKMASVSFKEKIILQILQRKLGKNSSPNPIGKDNLQKAIEMAANAAGDVPDNIKMVMDKPEAVIVGIGGVHNESIKKQLKSNARYTQEELINALQLRIELADQDIGGHYADTEISNMILVLGFMEKLGIKEIIPVNVNLADGVLIEPVFW